MDMKRRIWTVAAALTIVAAIVAVPAAYAAYTTAKLEVQRTATGMLISATGNPDDDPTAAVRIFAPTGTQLTTNQAPGTNLGRIRVLARGLDIGGAELPLEGPILVATPGQVSPADQAACLQGVTPLATWVLALGVAGQTLQVPAFLVATTGTQAALGPAYIQVCLRPPDVPAGTPGRQPFGAKVYSVNATVNGVFGAVPAGVWVSFWTPYRPGVGQVNVAGTVAAPAQLAGGTISATARRRGAGATVRGSVTQAGLQRAGFVTILGGPRANRLTRLGRVRAGANGLFSFRARAGLFFRAQVVATAANAPAVCAALGPAIAPVPCINPTISGFTAQSRVVRKR
jgi:hypothetical protein